MKRWPVILLFLAPLAGCVNDPGPDMDAYDGPYYYDGGGPPGSPYYDNPRTFDYDVEQRALYGRTYYYPSAYPYYYGGYGRPRYFRGDRDDYRGDRGDRNDARGGPDRTRTRDDDRAPSRPPAASPSRGSDNDGGDRAIQGARTKANTQSPDRPSRPSGGGSGGPHGGGRR